MFNQRLRVELIIGSNSLDKATLERVCEALSERYGGLTLVEAKGFWSAEGAKFQAHYSQIQAEASYIIILSMEVEKYDQWFIQQACLPLVGHADQIHMERYTTDSGHFSLEEMAKLTAA